MERWKLERSSEIRIYCPLTFFGWFWFSFACWKWTEFHEYLLLMIKYIQERLVHTGVLSVLFDFLHRYWTFHCLRRTKELIRNPAFLLVFLFLGLSSASLTRGVLSRWGSYSQSICLLLGINSVNAHLLF